MSRWSTLIDLEHETVRLDELIAQGAPDQAIEEEFDRCCMLYFDFTRHELTQEVSRVVLSGLYDWGYYQILDLGERHGFDFADKAMNEELSQFDLYRYPIYSWMYFAEMLIAKECGFFPTTQDEIGTVKLNRDARRFEEELRRQRQRPRPEDAERERVFGKAVREIKPGSIVARMNKGKGTSSVREVRIEVRPRGRRPPSGSSRRP